MFAPKLFAWRSYRHDNLCHSCLASKTILDCMYTDLILESACWLDTMISHDEYIESLGDDDRCPVLDIYGFEHSRALKDAMHGINLGVAQHACGNVLYEDVVRNCRLVKNYDEHLHKFWNTHKSWCRDRKLSTSIAQFSLAGINKKDNRSDSYPLLHAKAANTRILVAHLAETTGQQATSTPTSHCKLVAALMYSLASVFHVMESADRIFSDEQRRAFFKHGADFMRFYSALARETVTLGKAGKAWHIVPKHHYMGHLFLDARDSGVNPRFFSLFWR